MATAMTVTDADLARARHDPEFRRQLVKTSLDLLLREMNKLRSAAPARTQLKEGADLAVRLAALLQRIANESGASPAA
jgi:hypothetical protein